MNSQSFVVVINIASGIYIEGPVTESFKLKLASLVGHDI